MLADERWLTQIGWCLLIFDMITLAVTFNTDYHNLSNIIYIS